jgi:hypothetical protein
MSNTLAYITVAYFFTDILCDSVSNVGHYLHPLMLYSVLYLIKFKI